MPSRYSEDRREMPELGDTCNIYDLQRAAKPAKPAQAAMFDSMGDLPRPPKADYVIGK